MRQYTKEEIRAIISQLMTQCLQQLDVILLRQIEHGKDISKLSINEVSVTANG